MGITLELCYLGSSRLFLARTCGTFFCLIMNWVEISLYISAFFSNSVLDRNLVCRCPDGETFEQRGLEIVARTI